MPFITDDFEHLLVDDEEFVGSNEKYEEFVIARKLYVCQDEPFSDANYLQCRFRKYGHIESTEVLASGKEGYVTFTCDRHACLAYDREKQKCVEVAHTWHQPRQAHNNSESRQDQSTGTSPILKLNDHCLFAIFDLCDNRTLVHLSETCARFNRLLTGIYKFPKNKEFEFHGYEGNVGSLMSLALVRKILRLMGSYFMKLDFWLMDVPGPDAHRYFKTAMKYCQSNTRIRELRFDVEEWQCEYSTLIGPILENLQTIHLCVQENWNRIPDLPALCPNLRKMQINVFPTTFSAIKICNLESFSFKFYSNHLSHKRNVLKFFAENPQITVFKCDELLSDDLPDFASHLRNVRKLSFIVEEISSSNDFQHLKEFKHLTKLKLSFVSFGFQSMIDINLTETIECFRGLCSLTELKLYFKERNNMPVDEIQQSMLALSKMLRNLKRFDLVGLKLIDLTVVDFVRFAAKLESLHLHVTHVYATESLIKKLVTLRKSRKQGKLNFFVDKDLRNNVDQINDLENQQFLSVDWNCCHDLRFVKIMKQLKYI